MSMVDFSIAECMADSVLTPGANYWHVPNGHGSPDFDMTCAKDDPIVSHK